MNTNTHTNKKVGQVSRPPHLENRVKCIEKNTVYLFRAWKLCQALFHE